ncbi:MAG: ABC-F family ATP-binding cassette domain-containing protein [Bryobacteraceae bacterium]|nr:ABC-F family ATP-binding cassette domain-containing protein [Bryobacteraceae bacterium]MCX7603388.1 ABC-F family ATP-binding cassette domain-containing protein [Bryobacteraceae bacterium]
MGVLLTCQGISKQFGATVLFEGLTAAVHEGERHGLVGPNGAGKSTLLKILAGLEAPDAGTVSLRKGARVAYVSQEPEFPAGVTAGQVLEEAAHEESAAKTLLGQAGFRDPEVRVESLSGGWRKRLALAAALARKPDLLLLDEPTNHLDIAGIEWLEETLAEGEFAVIVISHDRYFLENTATHMMELNRAFPGGLFRVDGNYSAYLEKREQFFEAQAKAQASLAAKVRREIEWLRRGAKARTRKAKARVEAAQAMIEALEQAGARSTAETARIDFTATDRRTKKLVELEGVSLRVGGRELFRDVSLVLSPGRRLGVAGPNGSGKTSFLRLLLGELEASRGEVKRAPALRMVYFEQHRRQVDPSLPLRRALAPEGDTVIYLGRPVHVNGWAKRFLFREEQLVQPVSSLSGGERARLHLARLMLEPADVLLLDEPTNDLDIPTLDVLEESLLEFPGAVVLVTHDRYLMDRVANGVLGLDGEGGSGLFADLNQWEEWLEQRAREKARAARAEAAAPPRSAAAAPKKRLSYLEQREYEQIEQRIAEAEARLAGAQARLQAPETVCDPAKLAACWEEVRAAQEEVDRLYARWAELEEKLG